MKFKIPTTWLIIAVLIGLLFLQRECGTRCPDAPEPVTIHDTIPGDTVIQSIRVDAPYPVVTVLPPDTFIKIDSVQCWALAKNFYSRIIYLDTLKNDSSAFIAISDTVYKNSLQGRKVFFQNRRPTAINTFTFSAGEKPRNKIFIGPAIGRSLDNFAFCGSAMLLTKKDHAYTYTYDITNKDHYLGIYWKIRVKSQSTKKK